jgi:hypothetical protein
MEKDNQPFGVLKDIHDLDKFPVTKRASYIRQIVDHVNELKCGRCPHKDGCQILSFYDGIKSQGFIENRKIIDLQSKDFTNFINDLVNFCNKKGYHALLPGTSKATENCVATICATAGADIEVGLAGILIDIDNVQIILKLMIVVGRILAEKPAYLDEFYLEEAVRYGQQVLGIFDMESYIKQNSGKQKESETK